MTKRNDRAGAGTLADFPGHVPNRAKFGGVYLRADYAEVLTRLEPKAVTRTGPGRWESAPKPPPGTATEHGTRMKLLARERERIAQQQLGIRRR